LFEYEFLDGDRVNFILAIDRETKEIEAILGFLPCSKTSNPKELDMWGSIWKVNDSHKNITFLGVELVRRLKELIPHRYHIGVGINPNTTLPIRKKIFHEFTNKMNHYYLLNDKCNDYKIAVVNARNMNQIINETENEVIKFNSFDEFNNSFDVGKVKMIPHKDNGYIKKRFFEHPMHVYDVYGVKGTENLVEAIMIVRKVECNGSCVLRMVDYIGNSKLIAGLHTFFENLLRDSQAEYIDFYNFGYDENYFKSAGFSLRTDEDTNIIPNYFSPFVQQNIDIWVRSAYEGTIFCKGDGDQDRPNAI